MTNPAHCPECGIGAPYWRPDDVECDLCANDMTELLATLADDLEHDERDAVTNDVEELGKTIDLVRDMVDDIEDAARRTVEHAALNAAIDVHNAAVATIWRWQREARAKPSPRAGATTDET